MPGICLTRSIEDIVITKDDLATMVGSYFDQNGVLPYGAQGKINDKNISWEAIEQGFRYNLKILEKDLHAHDSIADFIEENKMEIVDKVQKKQAFEASLEFSRYSI